MKSDVPSVVFLNSGAEPQSPVSSIENRLHVFKNEKKLETKIFNLMKLVVTSPKG